LLEPVETFETNDSLYVSPLARFTKPGSMPVTHDVYVTEAADFCSTPFATSSDFVISNRSKLRSPDGALPLFFKNT